MGYREKVFRDKEQAGSCERGGLPLVAESRIGSWSPPGSELRFTRVAFS